LASALFIANESVVGLVVGLISQKLLHLWAAKDKEPESSIRPTTHATYGESQTGTMQQFLSWVERAGISTSKERRPVV
jgi:hypothetical protein